MKFQIERVSNSNDEISPCKNAIKEGNWWFVEINTIEELMELVKECCDSDKPGSAGYYANKLIVQEKHFDTGNPLIMVYDGYVE